MSHQTYSIKLPRSTIKFLKRYSTATHKPNKVVLQANLKVWPKKFLAIETLEYSARRLLIVSMKNTPHVFKALQILWGIINVNIKTF